jgi:tagaturonate reductase
MERILQFGTGRFLRGFVAAFVEDTNEAAAADRSQPPRVIDIVGSTDSGNAGRLAARGCRYRLLVRGAVGGMPIETVRNVTCIANAFDLRTEPAAVSAAGVDPELRLIVSNTTEAGYLPGPTAIPARLLDVLAERARAGLPGVTILPCELVERNAERLLSLVHEEARARSLPPDVSAHVLDANRWAVTLVDRIVTTPPPGLPAVDGDPLAVAAEPYASWVIERPTHAGHTSVPSHPSVREVTDAIPFAVRKIRILNGAHTALVTRTRGGPWQLVREAMDDVDIGAWLEDLLREEIVPALGDRIEDGQAFVTSVLERFRNPFLDHRLADIAVGHTDKIGTRLLPTFQEYRGRFGRPPKRLGWILEAEGLA